MENETHNNTQNHTHHTQPKTKPNNKKYIIAIVILSLLSAFLILDKIQDNSNQNSPLGEPELTLTVINDKACLTCDTSKIIQTTSQLFPTLNQKDIDINSPEGKLLVQKYSIEKVPSYLFSDNIVDTQVYKENPNLQKSFEKKSDLYHLKDEVTGAVVFIDTEKQAAFELQIAEKEKQSKQRLRIEGNKPQIDFFVMSYCPYGNQAEEGIEGAYQILKDKATFMPRYVLYSNYRGGGPEYCLDKESKYCSMHGIQELNQNIRERCVYEEYGTEEFFKFTLAMNKECNYKNADTCWQKVAENLGLSVNKISQCEKGRGLEFVREDKEFNELLGVQGSPTIFINGAAYNGGRDSQSYLNALCAAFDSNNRPRECGNTPEPIVQTTPVGGCGT